MRLPRFMTTIHFRLSALFLLMLAVLAGVYYYWIEVTIFSSDAAPGEDRWYESEAHAELDSLASLLAADLDDPEATESRLVEYGRRIAVFDAEVSLLDARGRLLASSRPDSLSIVLQRVEHALLDSMMTPAWDYAFYPNPHYMDAFENRIFDVHPVRRDGGDSGPLDGYLVASFQPVTIAVGEIEADTRRIWLQGMVALLVAAALCGLITMAYLSRRIQILSRGVDRFGEGDLGVRIPLGRSADEIGRLSRNFNTMADRLEAMIERLRQSDGFKRQLIANISHDLRTPLASVRGYAETLVASGDRIDREERRRFLEIISTNVDHLERLIQHLFTLSQLDSGQAVFNPEPFQLGELAHEVLDRCRGRAVEREVRLAVQREVDLPPVQIGQALQNLVENGIKFNRPRGEVTVTLSRAGGMVRTEVRDTGDGIPAADLPHIYERFFTADRSRSRKGESSGLGLAIAHKILEGHGASLEVESRVGEGSVFSFLLPVAAPPPPGA
jgi:signal transduction histidine kinase